MDLLRQRPLNTRGNSLLEATGDDAVTGLVGGAGGVDAGIMDVVGNGLLDGLGEFLLEFLGNDGVADGVGLVGGLAGHVCGGDDEKTFGCGKGYC